MRACGEYKHMPITASTCAGHRFAPELAPSLHDNHTKRCVFWEGGVVTCARLHDHSHHLGEIVQQLRRPVARLPACLCFPASSASHAPMKCDAVWLRFSQLTVLEQVVRRCGSLAQRRVRRVSIAKRATVKSGRRSTAPVGDLKLPSDTHPSLSAHSKKCYHISPLFSFPSMYISEWDAALPPRSCRHRGKEKFEGVALESLASCAPWGCESKTSNKQVRARERHRCGSRSLSLQVLVCI
jgi:hypothetical protein